MNCLYLCEEPLWVRADAIRMEEVLINLLDNAAKYTPDGGRIQVWCEADLAGKTASARIRDNGLGIDEEDIAHVFGLIAQADGSLDRRAGGLGIGLTRAPRLVELHGGRIDVSSPPPGSEHGSEFIVALPMVASPDDADKQHR